MKTLKQLFLSILFIYTLSACTSTLNSQDLKFEDLQRFKEDYKPELKNSENSNQYYLLINKMEQAMEEDKYIFGKIHLRTNEKYKYSDYKKLIDLFYVTPVTALKKPNKEFAYELITKFKNLEDNNQPVNYAAHQYEPKNREKVKERKNDKLHSKKMPDNERQQIIGENNAAKEEKRERKNYFKEKKNNEKKERKKYYAKKEEDEKLEE